MRLRPTVADGYVTIFSWANCVADRAFQQPIVYSIDVAVGESGSRSAFHKVRGEGFVSVELYTPGR